MKLAVKQKSPDSMGKTVSVSSHYVEMLVDSPGCLIFIGRMISPRDIKYDVTKTVIIKTMLLSS